MKKKADWLEKRVVLLFGKERLEEWKDTIARYWEKQLEGIDEQQLLRALVRFYGRKEGKRLLRASRSEKTKMLIEGEARWIVGQFARKLRRFAEGPEDRFSTQGLALEEHDYSEATVIHEGRTYTTLVDGIVCITGTVTVYHQDGSESIVKIFSKWVTHPFWQYSHSGQHFESEGEKNDKPLWKEYVPPAVRTAK